MSCLVISFILSSTGPKMSWASPNILCQTKNLITFSATPNQHYVYENEFWSDRHKKLGPAQPSILGPVEEQGIN